MFMQDIEKESIKNDSKSEVVDDEGFRFDENISEEFQKGFIPPNNIEREILDLNKKNEK